jgi:hypothetical protein
VTETLDVGFPLDDQHLRILGGIVALGALLEATAEGILCRLLAGDDWDHVRAVVGGQSVSWMLDRIPMVSSRDPGRGAAIDAWVPKAKAACEARNRLVHAAWFMRSPTTPHAVGYVSKRNGPRFDFRSLEDFEAVEGQVRAAYDEGVAIGNSMFGHDIESPDRPGPNA